jgi:uncharacterized membrane protein
VAELLGLIVSLVFLVLIFLPILTFLRLGRISRELEELAGRLAQLERRSAQPVEPVASAFAPGDTPGAAADKPAPLAPLAPPAPLAPLAPLAPPAPPAPPAPAPAVETVASAFAPSNAPGATADKPELPDLEERIGGRGLLYTGVLVLLFGVSFFLKYAFDNAWIDETGRLSLGALAGAGLVAAGWRLAGSGLAAFGQALAGTGFAILYLVIYAALNFYGLIDRAFAFSLMAAITLASAIVADRQRAQALAFIAVGGGFLTPALVGGDENAQLTLFSYDAVLVVGTLLLSLRHHWLALNALSYFGTLITVSAWAARYYTDDQWLRTLLFLTLFCVCFLMILRATRSSRGITAQAVYGLLLTAPLFYHVAAIVITAGHPPAIHVYLIAFSVAGLWLTVEPYRPLLRLAILLGAFVPLFGTLTLPNGLSWLVPNVVTIVAVAVLHVMALVDRVVRQEQRLSGADLVALHLSGLGVFALLYEALQPVFPEFRGGLAALIVVGAAGLTRLFRRHDEVAALNAMALAFALAAIGVAVQFDGATAIIGWAAEGAALVWLGARARRSAFQLGGLALWAFAAIRAFESFSDTPAAFTALLNARTFSTLFVVVSGYVMAWKLADASGPEATRLPTAVHVMASSLTLRWITAEIQSFWDVRSDTAPQAYLYEQMLLSLAWGLYGTAVIVVGMVRSYAPLRYIGIVVISFTSLKVFFYDLWELGGIYRVIGFIGFGVLLLLVSYLYQKRRKVKPLQSKDEALNEPTTPPRAP